MCFVGRGEPELIVAPQIAASHTDVPVGFIANCANVHYYACEPDTHGDACPEMPNAGNMTGDELLQHTSSPSQQTPMQHNTTAPSEDQLSRQSNMMQSSGASSDNVLFALCECLSKWDSFGIPSPEVGEIVRQQASVNPTNMAATSLQVLQWRDAIKLAQWERSERQAGLHREHVYQVAKQHLVSSGMAFNRNKTFTKSRKIANKLHLSKVVADISGPCEKQGTPHTCLHAFRLQPGAALQWRKLWYALPKQDRETRLVDEFANAFKAHTSAHHGDKAGFHMQFRMFGSQVCRAAFIALTGIHADTLQRARQIAMGVARPPLPPGFSAWIMHRPLTYINARAWLVQYAKTHADTSPMNDKLWLPAGRRQDYFAVYFNDRRAKQVAPQHIASESYFLKVFIVS